MRGCLTVILVAALAIFGLVWFKGPSVAATVIQVGLGAFGWSAETETVTVDANPPYIVLMGRADKVRIVATGVEVRGVRARAVTVTVGTVRLFDRTFATFSGRLTGAVVSDGSGNDLTVARIDLSGTGAALKVSLHLASGEVTNQVQRAIENASGATLSGITLSAPNVVVIALAGQTITAHLVIDSGRLVLRGAGDALGDPVLFDPSGSGFKLTGVAMAGGEVVLTGTLDPGSLIP
jgi:hypothetical protein